VQVIEAGCQHLCRDGAELHGLARLPLGDFPDVRIFQRAAGNLLHHVWQHARFKHLEHDVARRLVAARRGAPTPEVMTLQSAQALGGVAEPRAAAVSSQSQRASPSLKRSSPARV
jgi:hypothetical protein